MIIRATIANIVPRELAYRVQLAGLSGTVFPSIGAGNWGVEDGATVEFAGQPGCKVKEFIVSTLKIRHEESAYVTMGDAAILLHADRQEERL